MTDWISVDEQLPPENLVMKKTIDPNKLASLSKEEKLRLYDQLQLKKKLDLKKRNKFEPNSAQLPVLLSKKYIRLFAGGNGSGKTTLGVNVALAAASGYNPWTKEYTKCPSVGVVVLDNPLKTKEVWLKEMAKWTNMEEIEQLKNGRPHVNELVFKNGSRIIFMYAEQEDMVFESIELDWTIYDEPPKKSIFISLSRGQRTKGSKPWQLIIATPLAAPWLRQDIFEPWERGERDDVDCFRGSTEANKKNLAEGFIDQFSRLLSEEEKQVRLHGQFFDVGGLALKHLLVPDKHYISPYPWDINDAVVIAIDPHPSKKNVAVALGTTRFGQKIIIGEISAKSTARDFALKIHEWSRNWKVVDIVCDSLGSADTTGGEGFKSFIQVLKDCGLRVRATTFEEKDDEAWIDRIRSVLEVPQTPDQFGEQKPKLQVFRHCYGVIKDLENVAWLKHKNLDMNKPKLDISNKDFLACVKYALAADASNVSGDLRKQKTVHLANKKAVSLRSRYFRK